MRYTLPANELICKHFTCITYFDDLIFPGGSMALSRKPQGIQSPEQNQDINTLISELMIKRDRDNEDVMP
jgi:hypothetical protein